MRLATEEATRVWLTTHEVADELRIPEPTIRKHCRKGQLPGAVRIGKTWRIPADYAGKLTVAA